MPVIRPGHKAIGAHRMLADRKTVIADRLTGQIGNSLEYLGAPDLEQRGRRPRIDAARHLGNNAQLRRLQGKQIKLDARNVLDELSEGWIVLGNFGLYDPLEPVQVARRTADAGHAGTFVAEQKLRVSPTLVFLTDQVLDRDAHIFEEYVVDFVRSVDADDRAHGNARRLHVDQEERYAGLRLCRGVGSHQAEDPVGVLSQRGPGLVTIDDVVIAVPPRLGTDRGKVGAGARLRVALAPPILARQNPRQKLLLLRVVAERVDHRADHGDAKRQRRQRSGARRLLFEHKTLRDRPAGPAIFLRP